MAKIKIHIKVDDNGNVAVKQTPLRDNPKHKWKADDTVQFSSNRRDTAIKFTKGSPFAEFTRGDVLTNLKPAKGPFKVVTQRTSHFNCGHIVGSTFRRWAKTGSDFPLPC